MTDALDTQRLLDRLHAILLVDTLGAPYYDTGHLPRAINIPPHKVRELAPRLLMDRSAEIVVYGNDVDSSNARIVLEQLTRLGYTKLSLYVDGIEGWVTAGLPIESPP